MHQHDIKTGKCEDTGKIAETIFTDHDRPGCYNACKHCHDDQRTLAESLQDLLDKARTKAE